MCHLTRTIWPVGHGAFYTECFRNIDGKDTTFTTVYDCGAYQYGRPYVKDLDREIQGFVESIQDNDSDRPNVDVVFISHFDKDHVDGFMRLKNAVSSIKAIVIPNLLPSQLVRSFVRNIMESDTQEDWNELIHFYSLLIGREKGEMRIIRVPDTTSVNLHGDWVNLNLLQGMDGKLHPGTHLTIGKPHDGNPLWVYIPVHQSYDITKSNLLYQKILEAVELSPAVDLTVVFEKILAFCSSPRMHKKLLDIYHEIYGNIEDNDFSMPVYSGLYSDKVAGEYCVHADMFLREFHQHFHMHVHMDYDSQNTFFAPKAINCLYMGDYEVNKPGRLKRLKEHLGQYWYKVGLVQVPHHASQNNHNIHLYHPGQICFASVYDSNDCSYSIDVRNEIESLSSSFIKITEKSAPFVEEISLYV